MAVVVFKQLKKIELELNKIFFFIWNKKKIRKCLIQWDLSE